VASHKDIALFGVDSSLVLAAVLGLDVEGFLAHFIALDNVIVTVLAVVVVFLPTKITKAIIIMFLHGLVV